MKVLHVLNSGHLGGAETMAVNLCANFTKHGHSHSLLSFEHGPLSARSKELGMSHEIAESGSKSESRGQRWERMGLQLQAVVRSTQPDLVHSHLPLTNLLCNRVLPRMNVPWICTIHGSWRIFGYTPDTEQRPWLRPLYMLRHAIGDRLTTRSAARIVAISNYIAGELHQIGIAQSRISVVYNGLDASSEPLQDRTESRRQLGCSDQDQIISAVGFFSPVKGFDLLIKAIALIEKRHPKVKLIIVGRGVLGDERSADGLNALIRKVGLEDRISLESDSAKMETVLSASDLLCVPSRSEGFSLVLLQAMQHGLSSVVTSAGGCAEVARPGLESLVYNSPNIDAMAIALNELLSNEELRSRLGAAAAARASDFSLEQCMMGYERVYGQVMKAKISV